MANTEIITGVAATTTHLFVLRADGTLYVRPVDDLETEERIHGVANLEGRISVVAPALTHVILTSEGTDQGYWVDMREGVPRWAQPLGLDPPASDTIEVVQTMPPFDEGDDAFVVYGFTYIREFKVGSREVPPDELFNGMESDLSEVQYVLTRPHNSPKTQLTGNPIWEWTNDSSVATGKIGRDGNTILISVVDSEGDNHRQKMLNALNRMSGSRLKISPAASTTAQITGTVSSVPSGIDAHLRLTLTDIEDMTISDGTNLKFELLSAAIAAGFDLEAEEYYPALIQGFSFPVELGQVTGINIYRSRIFRDSDDYERIKKLIDENDENLDLNTLEFRKIRTILRTSVPHIVLDGEEASGKPYYQILNAVGRTPLSKKTYEWSSQDQLEAGQNLRMPEAVKQIHYHGARIFAPMGDRLIYSDFDGTIPRFWSFPKRNFHTRNDSGRIDFCASHREVLLVGGIDGLFRLTGQDRSDFNLDQISGAGPLDGYSWGALENTLGFIGTKGLYVTDGAEVKFVSDESLDGFFTAKTVVHASVAYFVDNTILFFVRLQTIGAAKMTDNLFFFDDRHWVRWSGESIAQFAVVRGQVYVAGRAALRKVELDEGENMDPDLSWAWESNLIHGQAQGVSNITKRFAELLLSAAEGTDAKLKTWVDTQEGTN